MLVTVLPKGEQIVFASGKKHSENNMTFRGRGDEILKFNLDSSGDLGNIQFEGDVPMDDRTRIELEAAAFRTLVTHLRERTDVQNIDLMNLAGFCRNCLSRWYREAGDERGLTIPDPQAREIVYGMPYNEWKAKYQKEATPEQKAKSATAHKH